MFTKHKHKYGVVHVCPLDCFIMHLFSNTYWLRYIMGVQCACGKRKYDYV